MSILEQIIQSPRLPQYLVQLQDLLDGEHQRREEFIEHVTENQKAEFINGDTVVHSPVKLRHAEASLNLATMLRVYCSQRKLGLVAHEKLLISLTRNDYEPDICFFRAERAAGFAPDQMRFPAPDFVVEVLSPSTEANDRGVKLEDYAAHGVAEYWLIDPVDETLEQYLLAQPSEFGMQDSDVSATPAGLIDDQGAQYLLNIKARNGVVTSLAVPGFEIPVRAIFDAEQQGMALRALLDR
ncbi:MAG: Uma2 family endonuclease [Roseiflexaceae bacterium]|nr:Uma2 family endonuclease [Roseiflexaceae bacterium]